MHGLKSRNTRISRRCIGALLTLALSVLVVALLELYRHNRPAGAARPA